MVIINSIKSNQEINLTESNLPKVRLSDHGFTIFQIETMLACNMRCTFCAYPLIEKKGTKLSKQTVFNLIDSIDSKDEQLEYICFNQYNEPLLDDRIYEFIKYAKNKNIPVKIITNGLLLNSEKVRKKLLESEPTYIKISLETINKNSFSYARGIKYSYEKYIIGIFEFLKLVLRSDSATETNIDLACNFLTLKNLLLRTILGIEKGDPSVPNTTNDLKAGFTNLLESLSDFEPRFHVDIDEMSDYLDKVNNNYLTQESFEVSPKIHFKIKPFIFGRRLDKFYPAMFPVKCETRILSVLASGSVVPCCLAYDDMLSMGNINIKSLPQIIGENVEFISTVKKGNRKLKICQKCKGAPSKRGALFISLLRLLKQKII